MVRFGVLFCLVFAAASAMAQSCPSTSKDGSLTDSAEVENAGRLMYHDGIRQWFELELTQPVCGQHSLQVTPSEKDHSYETYRGCKVTVLGGMYLSPTGYYSLALAQSADRVRAATGCLVRAPLPQIKPGRPARSMKRYRVVMHVNYRGGDHPIRFDIRSVAKQLKPWQTYASYFFTGGFVLYGYCGKGFFVTRAFGTREAQPRVFDEAVFDPERAAQRGKYDLMLGYTCVRDSSEGN